MKKSSALDKKLMAANALVSKAKESSATVEAQIKESKSRKSGEGAGLGLNSAEKFQQKVATAAAGREPFALGSLRNFKRQRKTVLETTNAQAVDGEIENLLSEGRGGGAKSNQTKAQPKPQSKPKPQPKPQPKSKPKPEKKTRNEDDEYEEDYEQEYEEEQEEEQEEPQEYEEEEPEQEEQEEDQEPISTVFEDSEFGPTDKDPSGVKSIGPVISDKVSGIQWTRMEKIADMGKCYFIEDKSKPLDPKNSFWIRKVIQGHGDLDFLNALVLTATNSELFIRLYDPSFDKFFEQGVYVFQFYKNSNQTYYVIVDDRIPSIQNQAGEHIPIGARSDKGSDYWVTLIEKAYSKLHMNYDNMCSNHLTFQNHFLALTGLMAEEIPIDSSTLDSALLWEFLTNFNKFKLPMGCRQDKDDVEGPLSVAGGHIYIIVDVLEEKGNKMLKIANPWKNAPELVETKGNSGISKINYDDFLNSFSTFILVKDFPKDWKGVKFECEIISSKGPPTISNNTWIDNPQYVFEVKDKEQGNIIIRLHRYVGIQSLSLESLGSQFGFAVFNLTPTELTLRTPDLKRNITITKSNEGESIVVANLSLAQGKYSVIPYTVEKGEAAFFYCEFFFDFKENMISLNPNINAKRILEPSLIKKAAMQSWKPRVLKSTLRLSEVEGDALDEAGDNTLLFVPHATTKILYKEGIPKVLTRATTKEDASISNKPQMSRGLSSTSTKINVNKRLFDLKIDGQQDYEITAALFGLAPETGRNSVKNKGAPREDENEELDFEILAELETIVDLNNYGLTDVGLNAVLDAVIQIKKITSLKLAGNQLTDNGIINLVDKLERSHHFELEELDVSNNSIGRFGGDLILDMSKTFKNLTKINIDGNKDISDQTKNKTNFSLKKKAAAKV